MALIGIAGKSNSTPRIWSSRHQERYRFPVPRSRTRESYRGHGPNQAHVCVFVCVCMGVHMRQWERWQQVAKKLMSGEGTCFTRVISYRDTHPRRWLPVINTVTSCRGGETGWRFSPALALAGPGLSTHGFGKIGNVFLWGAWEDFIGLCSELFMLKSAFPCS